MIQSVYVVSPPEYVHSAGLHDIALSFQHSLRDIGHHVGITVEPGGIVGKALVFGAHLIPKFGGSIDGDYVIFNSEQLYDGSPWVTDAYLDILRRHETWDYSLNNIEYLKSKGIEAKHCEIGYHPCMSNILSGKSATITGESSIEYKPRGIGLAVGVYDVLFYGSLNERRQKIIDDLRSKGKNVVIVNGYGAYRDKYIERARVVLNLHYYDTALFEIFRVGHLLANRKCVVSEYGKEPGLEAPYRLGVAFCPYDSIVDTCMDLLGDDILRSDIADTGFGNFKSRAQAEILRKLCL